MGILRIEDPFAQGIEEDVSGQAGGEHHRSPGEIGVERLFSRLAQTDGAVLRKGEVDGEKENTEARGQIKRPEFFSQKGPDSGQNLL